MAEGLEGARILLGVTGSIAAYKAAEIARLLIQRGACVQVAMTKAAEKFVAPLTFRAITSHPVLTDLFESYGAVDARVTAFEAVGSVFEREPPAFEHALSNIEHVEQAHMIDLVVVAPATANTLARFAVGLADDVLSAIVLATRAPILVAPAMETGMWENAATRANVATLQARGFSVVGPAAGALASGRAGIGRMAEPEAVVRAAFGLLRPRDFRGLGVLVTAGPTWEALDPVRILANRSTGAMGIEIARAAAERGADVTLILGPTHLEPPLEGPIRTVHVESAQEMLDAGRAALVAKHILIGSAAVSDFRPEEERSTKLKRSSPAARALRLTENPDVLATLSAEMRARVGADSQVTIVGFAAETEDLEKNAREKLARKGCDLVIANLVGRTKGFGEGSTSVLAVPHPDRGPPVGFGPAAKTEIAQFVLDQVLWVRKQRESR